MNRKRNSKGQFVSEKALQDHNLSKTEKGKLSWLNYIFRNTPLILFIIIMLINFVYLILWIYIKLNDLFS